MQRSVAVEASRRFRPRAVAPRQVWRWLELGLRDLTRCPGPGLVHGLAAALFGAALFGAAIHHFWFVVGAFSGLLIVAPVVATGMYAISRALERGEAAGWPAVRAVWHPRHGRLVAFGLLLALAGTGWVLTSAALITRFAPAPVNGLVDFLRIVVLGPGWLFEAWLVLGAVLAAPMFASSVVAMPMLLDREVPVAVAVLTSWRVVMESPAALAAWALLISALMLVGLVTGLVGLVIVLPWLGHASWHAYRDLVDGELAGG